SMMKTRHQIAILLGYSSWADYNAADKMIKTGGNIGDFIQKIDSAARPIAKREYDMLLAEKQKADPNAKDVGDYEVSYLSELVRRSQFNFDSQAVRPYLPFNEVRKGILETASTLFHVTFQQEENVPAWDPSVETWDVVDKGKTVGRFYLDMHPRPGKYSHAEMSPVLDGIRGKQMPEAIERMNRATAFGRGTWVSQQNEYTAISYDVYKTKLENVDLDAVTAADQKKYTLFTPLPDTHLYSAFGHLGGYSSAYYTYLWDKVIAEDFFSQ